MPNPRKITDFSEIDALQVTFAHDSSIVYDANLAGNSAQVGKAVRLTSARTVGLTIDGSHVLGKLINVDADGFCAVQVRGFCELPGGTGATFTLGLGVVGDLDGAAAGFIRGVTLAGAAYGEPAADETQAASGTVIDAAVLAAVWVDLG